MTHEEIENLLIDDTFYVLTPNRALLTLSVVDVDNVHRVVKCKMDTGSHRTLTYELLLSDGFLDKELAECSLFIRERKLFQDAINECKADLKTFERELMQLNDKYDYLEEKYPEEFL